MAKPALGHSSATAAANAAADAAWPDGNDDEIGDSALSRYAGGSGTGGRRRGSSGLSTALVVKLVAAIARTPRSAARRVAPLLADSAAAIANQSTLWFVAVLRLFVTTSSRLDGRRPIHREIARSMWSTSSD